MDDGMKVLVAWVMGCAAGALAVNFFSTWHWGYGLGVALLCFGYIYLRATVSS